MVVGSKWFLDFLLIFEFGNYHIYDSIMNPLLNSSQEMGKQNRKCHSAILPPHSVISFWTQEVFVVIQA